uniref:uncharacterized protein LOC122587606 n=1 Tax=Erigeron canadensis TaxID=72917 RepID=UPI001CB9769E|nr:uncharacterized protein LOC122587606 [Erigeron canadensis]
MSRSNEHIIVTCLHILAALYWVLRKYDEGIPIIEKSMKITNIKEGQKHMLAKFSVCSLVINSLHGKDRMSKLLEEAENRRLVRFICNSMHLNVAGVAAQFGSYSDSYEYFEASISKFRAAGEKKSGVLGIALNQMGLACVQINLSGKAAFCLKKVEAFWEQNAGLNIRIYSLGFMSILLVPMMQWGRMLDSSYNLLFGKLALKSLFEDYFDAANHFSTIFMLKPIEDRHVDLVATVSGPLDNNPEVTIDGNALFRWQSDADDPHTFTDLYVSSSDPILLMRACAYYPRYGFGAFGIFPVLQKERVRSEDYGTMGLRYGSSNLSFGATLFPYSLGNDFPNTAWLVTKIGRLTAGAQYDPRFEKKDGAKYKNLKNWNYAVGYGIGSGSPLKPSFNFGLEFAQNSQFIASFYQHVVVQRRVKNPLEENEVIGITNYIDFGFELLTRMVDQKGSNDIQDATFNVAASWQANKNILLKGKVGPLSSSISLSFKSWWKPSFSFSVSAIRDRAIGKTSFGFGLRVDNVREASYERADPNFVMLTPNKEHLAEGIHWKSGKRPMLQSDINSGNFDGVPRELRPLAKML